MRVFSIRLKPGETGSFGTNPVALRLSEKERVQVLLSSKCKLIMCKVLMLLKHNPWRGSPGCWNRV